MLSTCRWQTQMHDFATAGSDCYSFALVVSYADLFWLFFCGVGWNYAAGNFAVHSTDASWHLRIWLVESCAFIITQDVPCIEISNQSIVSLFRFVNKLASRTIFVWSIARGGGFTRAEFAGPSCVVADAQLQVRKKCCKLDHQSSRFEHLHLVPAASTFADGLYVFANPALMAMHKAVTKWLSMQIYDPVTIWEMLVLTDHPLWFAMQTHDSQTIHCKVTPEFTIEGTRTIAVLQAVVANFLALEKNLEARYLQTNRRQVRR